MLPWNEEYPNRCNRLCVGITVSSHTKGLEKIKPKKNINFQYATTGQSNQTYKRIITRIFTNLYIFANYRLFKSVKWTKIFLTNTAIKCKTGTSKN